MKINLNKLIGTLFIIANILYIWNNFELYYEYHNTNILFAFRLPDWVLLLNVFLSVVGIYNGLKIFQEVWTLKKGLLIQIALIVIAFLNQIIIVS